MFADEAGQDDFTISTAGHGKFGVTYAKLTSDGMSVLTSSTLPTLSTSSLSDNHQVNVKDCYLSSRSLEDGSLNWRKNVCSTGSGAGTGTGVTSSSNIRHAVYSNTGDKYVYTMDDVGMLRKWDERNGDLFQQVIIQTNDSDSDNGSDSDSDNGSDSGAVPGQFPPRLFPLSDTIIGCVSVKSLDSISLYNMKDLSIVQEEPNDGSSSSSSSSSIISAMTILSKAKVKKNHGSNGNGNDNENENDNNNISPQIIQIMDGTIVAAWVNTTNNNNNGMTSTTTSFDQMAVYEYTTTKEYKKLHHHSSSSSFSSTLLDASTVTVIDGGKSITAMTTTTMDNNGTSILVYTPNEKLEEMYSHTDIDTNTNTATSLLAEKMNGIVYNGKGMLRCNNVMTTISKNGVLDSGSVQNVPIVTGYGYGHSYDSVDGSASNGNAPNFVQMLHCNSESMVGLVATMSGSTFVFQKTFGGDGGGDTLEKKFWAEEAMGSVTSATFLSYTHDSDVDSGGEEDEDEDVILQSLSFSSRLESQYQSLVNFVSGGFIDQAKAVLKKSGSGSSSGGNDTNGKDIIFGLKKVAVMLSDPFSKLLGVDTSAGTINWTMSLNPQASWHKVVHGTSSSRSSVFGQGMHHPHSPEILVLSKLADAVEWRCVDGLRGRVISKSQIALSSKSIAQIMPIHVHSHGGGGCKQNALLLLEDDSLLVVPNTSQSVTETSKVFASGFYTHKIDKETGLFTTMKIQKDSDKAVVIGETIFDPLTEKIVNVVYPQRNEVVQSPATILGDDSLLLKYLNPHLCVVVTEVTEHLMQHLKEEEGNAFYSALSSSKKGSGSSEKQKTKPVGVTKPGEESPSVAKSLTPTLFINIVDTVSGQILHRVSHAHVGPGATLADAVNVPVVISENWIVYAFPNARTRRTELGVMSLHEGMIDKQGISAFSTPEQQESFSSLTSAKPIVLTKTYALAVPVSAIGVTNTKNGISSKNIILATGSSGQIIRVDRRLLDPRRPSGEPKESEKKEGLMQYAPLLPTAPLMVQSYTNNIEEVSSIQSTAANLESQTLIIAYGGPDVFFTRFAPSKGFDSLPESFNKFAIIMVLVGLYAILNTLKKMSEKKIVKLGWA